MTSKKHLKKYNSPTQLLCCPNKVKASKIFTFSKKKPNFWKIKNFSPSQVIFCRAKTEKNCNYQFFQNLGCQTILKCFLKGANFCYI